MQIEYFIRVKSIACFRFSKKAYRRVKIQFLTPQAEGGAGGYPPGYIDKNILNRSRRQRSRRK